MKKRILVVDDEESIRWVLGKYLEKAGYTVKYAENGTQRFFVNNTRYHNAGYERF